MTLENKVIGFIGGGNMATAIVGGILKKGLVKTSQIIVSAPSELTLEKWRKLGIFGTPSNREIVNKSDIIILSFKPYQIEEALNDLKVNIENNESKLFVSLLAGISSDQIYNKVSACVYANCRVIRVMPNSPLLVCEGCTAISVHDSASREDVNIVQNIFASLGKSKVVKESQISAITGLVGSGPAYIYVILEALSDAGVKMGLPRSLATEFAAQTTLGAAKMVLETNKHPAELKDEVCSSGGTTIYGLHSLEKSGLRAAIINAVEAAVLRSFEISASQVSYKK